MFDTKWVYKVKERKEDILNELLSLFNIENQDEFLNPLDAELHDPYLMNDMADAVKRISKAIGNSEKICIYGDYDADGLTSAAILYRFLKKQNKNTECFIPDRFDDGYGLNTESLKKIIENGATLIITTDCGINSVEEASFLREQEIDLIITDHHISNGILPDATAVICCTRNDSNYPYRYLSGAGTAFKLTEALRLSLELQPDDNLLALAAVGTVTDIMPLTGENRNIVAKGLVLLRKSVNCGLDSLFRLSGTDPSDINTYSIGFAAGPRINAAGRMGDASSALNLLITEDKKEAENISVLLNKYNNERKNLQDKVYKDVLGKLAAGGKNNPDHIIIEGDESYSKGVIGIVASKIGELYNRPAIIYSEKNGIAEGSGRSPGELSLIEILNYCSDVFIGYGGHDKAAGVSFKSENLRLFKDKANEYINSNGLMSDNKKTIELIFEVLTDELTLDTAGLLSRFEPFGNGNPKPVFALHEAELMDYRMVGKTKNHAIMTFSKNDRFYKAIAFGSGKYEPLFYKGETYDIAFNMDINEFRGNTSLQLQVIDMKIPDSDENNFDFMIVRLLVHMLKYEKANNDDIPDLFFRNGMPGFAEHFLSRKNEFRLSRDDVKTVYQKTRAADAQLTFDIRTAAELIPLWKSCLSTEILIELGILNMKSAGMYKYEVIGKNNLRKRDLEESVLYRLMGV